MSNSLEERLKSNSSAFEGLLSLIPAKYYYDDKTQEQWNAKKKSKGQLKEDKKSKLDPEQQDDESSSALEVMKKKQAQAKAVVLPGQKKIQRELLDAESETSSEDDEDEEDEEEDEEEQTEEQESDEVPEINISQTLGESESIAVIFDDDGNPVDQNKQKQEKERIQKKQEAIERTKDDSSQKKKKMEELRCKLQEKIKALKEKRKAPGTKVEGAPSSREAILAQRKRRQEVRATKLDSEKAGDVSSDDSADSDSDSDAEDAHVSKKHRRNGDEEISAKDVMFQSIQFNDGTKATSDLSHVRKGERKKGPAKKDVKAHLRLLETKKQSLESRDELDQIKLKEKEKWQKAMLQAEGIRLKDDEKLLRKALKRKEAKKRKSTVEWRERKQVVENTVAERQKRREENLQIRKDNKGKKKSKQQKMKRKFKGTAHLKKRAGFEGRMKSVKKK